MEKQKNCRISPYVIHSVVGVLIMLLFKFLPAPSPITPLGMQVLGAFFGVIYLWTFVDAIWPSILGVFLLGLSSFAPMNQVMMNFLGDPIVVQLIFIMVFIGALVQSGITNHIGRWFLTRKIINGRPWIFTGMLLLGAYFLASISSAFAAIFLFWPILYGIFKEVGYKSGDKYATTSLIAVVMASLFGFSTAPFKDVPLILIGNYKKLTGIQLNEMSYLIMALILSLLCIIGIILLMKYIIKVDVSKLASVNTEMFTKNPLPALNIRQKILAGTFILYIISMLLPGILPKDLALQSILDQNKLGFALFIVAIMCAVKLNGKSIIDFQATISSHVQWSSVFIIAAALTIGNAVTNEATGVTAFLKELFTPIFGGTTEFVFITLLLVIGLILTNLCNSAVVGMIFLPIAFTFSGTLNIASEPIIAIFIYVVLLAAITPAASPFAAILHGNKEWVETKDIYKYTTIMSIVVLIIAIVIGIPLAKLLF